MNNIKNIAKKALALTLVSVFIFTISPNIILPISAEYENWIDFADVEWYESNPNNDTYEISTTEQLAGLAKIVNDGMSFDKKIVLLNNDLDLSGKQWTPIGSMDETPFSGTFDGQDHAISDIYIENENCCNGLFGSINSSEIKNVRIIGGLIKGAKLVGSITGSASGSSSINSCCNSATISGNESKISSELLPITNKVNNLGEDNIGGIAGKVCDAVSVVNCHNTGKVNCGSCIGGIVGVASNLCSLEFAWKIPEIKDCHNEGDISGDNCVGGIFGEGVKAINCHNKGTITGKGNCVGGIIGNSLEKTKGLDGKYEFSPSNIENCHNAGTVIGNNNIGGIVGDAKNNIYNCYNNGTVKKNDDCIDEKGGKNIGGIVGRIGGNLLNCYNTGTIIGEKRVGGVVGCIFFVFDSCSCYPPIKSKCYTSVENCYNLGNVMGQIDIGGVIGCTDKDFPVKNCYYIGAKVGIGTIPDNGRKVIPFANISLSNKAISINDSTTVNRKNNIEIAAKNLNGSEKMGTNFNVYINLESDNCEVATTNGAMVNGIAEGTANITCKLIIVQNSLTESGWTGIPETIEFNLGSSSITVQNSTKCLIE